MITRLRKAMYAQLVPLIVGFTVLAAIVVGRSLLIEQVRLDTEAASAALSFERGVVGLLSLVQDAETGQRGFLLTSEPAYLEPYQVAVRSIPDEIASLRGMVGGNDRRLLQVDTLDAAIESKLSELAQTLQTLSLIHI